MADIYTAVTEIVNGLSKTMEDCGFKVIVPDGASKDEFPATVESGRITVKYRGENKALKIEHFNNLISLYGVNKEGEILESDYTKLTSSLLDEENCDAKGVRYVVNDFSETLIETFGTKDIKPVKSKLPPPVSKAAAKSGAVSYDPNTLANRFTTIYPELRDAYKENCEKFGQFLPEDFFDNHGTKVVMDTIRENNPTKMKKLFNLFNDIYEDGTNETQSIIVVTILGKIDNDTEMLANCVDYMSDDLTIPVINVNKYLGSGAGKSAKARMENPPKYKPKKDKKKGILNRLGDMQ